MLKQIQQSIKKHRLLSEGQRVLVAVSGGADSVALLSVLRELAGTLGISLTVGHLNHCIRGKAADDDEAFVKKLAGQLKVPFVHGRSDVPRQARRKGISLEMAAREARYVFFARAARKVAADVVATGHTADDQAETVLLKLARGAGPRGLGGIPRGIVLRGLRVVRPLLDMSRSDIVAFLREKQLPWREDESNRDVSLLRNRVRHEILPLLELKLNPKVRRALSRTAEVIREEDRWLDELGRGVLADCISGDGALDIEKLKNHPLPVMRRVLRLWLVSSGVQPELIDFDIVSRIETLLQRKKGSGEMDIAGNWAVKKRYKQMLVERKKYRPAVRAFRASVKISGETLLTDIKLCVATSVGPGLVKAKTVRPGMLPARASIRHSAVGRKKIFVRSWRKGDRMRPLGLNGSKKIQDIFVDGKVPAGQRGEVPLFECGGEIIWLPGYRVARGWEVKDPAKPAIQVSIERF